MRRPPTHRTDARGVVLVLDADRYRAAHPDADVVTCGECGRSWDDAVVTGWTPAPSARCPYEGSRRYRPRRTGHALRRTLFGQTYCETCQSPYCEGA